MYPSEIVRDTGKVGDISDYEFGNVRSAERDPMDDRDAVDITGRSKASRWENYGHCRLYINVYSGPSFFVDLSEGSAAAKKPTWVDDYNIEIGGDTMTVEIESRPFTYTFEIEIER